MTAKGILINPWKLARAGIDYLKGARDPLRTLHEDHALGPTGIRFEPQRPGPGEEIEDRTLPH